MSITTREQVMTPIQAGKLTDRGDRQHGPHFFMVWMPYLFQRVEVPGKKHAFLPLNRDYKPLGMPRADWFDYDQEALTKGVVFRRDPATFEGIWTAQRDGMFWLYDDGEKSRLDYFRRLERLMVKSVPMIQVRR